MFLLLIVCVLFSVPLFCFRILFFEPKVLSFVTYTHIWSLHARDEIFFICLLIRILWPVSYISVARLYKL